MTTSIENAASEGSTVEPTWVPAGPILVVPEKVTMSRRRGTLLVTLVAGMVTALFLAWTSPSDESSRGVTTPQPRPEYVECVDDAIAVRGHAHLSPELVADRRESARAGVPANSLDLPAELVPVERKEIMVAGEKYFDESTSSCLRLFYISGERWYEASLVDGRREGVGRGWYENGQLRAVESFASGERDGSALYFYESGAKNAEGSFLHGVRDGLWREWYANGQMRSEGAYRAVSMDDGSWSAEKCGWWSCWNADGSIDHVRTGNYVDDDRRDS